MVGVEEVLQTAGLYLGIEQMVTDESLLLVSALRILSVG
jgi:hypothetical protein